jgi:tripartite-type tricarboxylate transporter receptor subunit TctC
VTKLSRRQVCRLGAGAAILPVLPAEIRAANAESYPSRPVRMVVGFPPGTTTDIGSRLIAQSLSERLGQQFIVDNRPGAASNVGTEFVARAAPDGYTLLAVTSINTVNASLYDNLNFDLLRDIAPIAGVLRSPNVILVNTSVPAKTVPEFIAYAKANPGKLNMASVGNGSSSHIAGELFKNLTGINLVHVPYRGSYFPDLLAGQVQVAFSPIPSGMGYIKAGTLRALAVTGLARVESLPDLPAAREFVPGYEASLWVGVGGPKGTPGDVIDKLSKEVGTSLAEPAIRTQLANLAADPMPMSSAEFAKLIADETEKWAKVVKASGIKPE